jgi:CRISPR system Cascade subunit CasE
MYLSRLVLNSTHARAIDDIKNPYLLHQTVMTAFQADLPDDERVLWRLDTTFTCLQKPTLLVQSVHQPDWTTIVSGVGAYAGAYLETMPRNPAITQWQEWPAQRGDHWRFRLRANTTVCPTDSKKRVGIYEPEGAREWLASRASRAGFQVVDAQMLALTKLTFTRRRRGNGHRITLASTLFDGVLRVRDADALTESLRDGIGPAKAFGHGLLSLGHRVSV